MKDIVHMTENEMVDAAAKYVRREECKNGVAGAVILLRALARQEEKHEYYPHNPNPMSKNQAFPLSAYYRQMANMLQAAGCVDRRDLDQVIFGGRNELARTRQKDEHHCG